MKEIAVLISMIVASSFFIILAILIMRRRLSREMRGKAAYYSSVKPARKKLVAKPANLPPTGPIWSEEKARTKRSKKTPPLYPKDPRYRRPTKKQIEKTKKELWGA